jgi:hypothetical protein
MHSSPKAPSVVLRTCELSPAGRSSEDSLETSALPRTDSPSLHSCSASGSASSFLLASALSLHEPLRTPDAEDARCVQPTSATRTKTITRPPYVLDSRRRLSPSGKPRNSPWLSRCMIEATSIFTMPEALWPHFSGYPRTRCPRALVLAALGHERRPFRHCGARWDETSDTSVANPSSSSRSRHLRAWSRVQSRVLMVSDDANGSEE